MIENYEKLNTMNEYVVVDIISEMRTFLRKRYVMVDVELDTETGFSFVVFDKLNKYDSIENILKRLDGELVIEKIFNINEQAKYYLSDEFDCTVVDVGVDKRIGRNGINKNFFYIKFLYDDELKRAKTNWMTRNR